MDEIGNTSFPRGGLLATGDKESYEAFAKKNLIAVSQGGAALAKAVWDDFKAAGFNVEEDIKYLSDNQGTRYFLRSEPNPSKERHFDLGKWPQFEITITGWVIHLKTEHFDITHTFTTQQEGL
ncbi:MAG: hypothetical protein ACRCTP_04475 [Aeromonas popoffii]|uniref:hypothetical protein n=1 Tax=Aeromonas popoffii TaxID=70856 RepID=UPI003F416255